MFLEITEKELALGLLQFFEHGALLNLTLEHFEQKGNEAQISIKIQDLKHRRLEHCKHLLAGRSCNPASFRQEDQHRLHSRLHTGVRQIHAEKFVNGAGLVVDGAHAQAQLIGDGRVR